MSEIKRTPKGTSRIGFGIVSPFGDMWTTKIFTTEEEARKHLADFWRSFPGDKGIDRYKIVKAMQTTEFVGEVVAETP